MTKARRRIVRIALMLQVAGIEPAFAGCNYPAMKAGLDLQLSRITPSRRKAARRQALRLISEAGGLEKAADHLVPHPPQQNSSGREPPIQPSPKQIRRCSVCRMRYGFKRSFSSQEAARKVCERQRDPALVVYPCPAGSGWHIGHRPDTVPAAAVYRATTTPPRREMYCADARMAPMSPTPPNKESPMKMNVTLGNPFLIAIYSAALLLIGCAIGRWAHTPATALWLAIAGGVLMAVHDTVTGVLWFWLAARWVHSAIERRKDR